MFFFEKKPIQIRAGASMALEDIKVVVGLVVRWLADNASDSDNNNDNDGQQDDNRKYVPPKTAMNWLVCRR